MKSRACATGPGPLPVKHAHGFIVQTMADLGIVGLVLALLLLGTWMAAAGRSTHPLQPPLAQLGRAALREQRPAWEPAAARQDPALRTRAHRSADAGVHGGAVRRPLERGLDLVRAWDRARGADVRRLAGGSRAAAGPGGGAERGVIERRHAAVAARAPRRDRASGSRAHRGGRSDRRRGAADRLDAVAAAALRRSAGKRARPSRARPDRGGRGGAQRGLPRSAVGRSAVRPGERPGIDRPAAARRGRRSSEPCGCSPRTRARGSRWAASTSPATRRRRSQEFRAGIYLDPASISPEALTVGHPEAVETYDDYVQALRALAAQEAALKTANARRLRAKAAAHRAARRRAARKAARNRTRP